METSWPQNSIIYQIYPRSFKDTNNDGIGDIPGIIEKVPYLVDLGINAVWLSPIYSSPQVDYGYDVSNHRDIDPIFGTLKDFDKLVALLHKNKIKIIMDFIPNHTSSKHTWFEESRKSKTNPKRDWYIWADPKKDGKEPNNWLSNFGGSAWKLDPKTNQFYYHSFDQDQPDLNWRNPEVVTEMLDTMRFWLDRGVDGFRVDAVNYLYKDPSLKDEPQNPNYAGGFYLNPHDSLLHIYTLDQSDSIRILKEMAGVLQEYKNKFMVTEAITELPELIKMYKAVDWHAYQPFNFSLIRLPWDANSHKEYIDEYENALSNHYLPCYVLGNHDKPRVVTRIGKKQARNAAVLLFTLRGNSFIYNGEEIGMRDRRIPKYKARDTYDLHSPGLGLGRNPARTPMQWDESLDAGFSQTPPWLPVSLNYRNVNVKVEENNPRSMLTLYKKLIKLKTNNETVAYGDYISYPIPAPDVFAFVRKSDKEEILVLVNFSNRQRRIKLPLGKSKVILNNFLDRIEGEKLDLSNFKLRGDESIILSIS